MAVIRDDVSTGRRLYVQTKYGEPAVEFLKGIDAHWDKEQKMWWVSPTKRPQVEEALVASDRKQDEDEEAGKPVPGEDPHKVKILAKVKYKGRVYYARFLGDTKKGHAARLVTLDGTIDFWADLARPGQEAADGQAEVVKVYEPREVWDGRRYSGKTVLRYTTLGSLRDFVATQKADRAAGLPTCAACGKSGELVADLEDGMMKHPRCCDIEP